MRTASRTSWRWIISLAAIMFVAAIVVSIVTYNYRPPQFRRFVSQPLSDGTRYTFLYPAHLDRVTEGGGGSPDVTHSVTVSKKDRSNEAARDWIRTRLSLAVPPDAETVTVVVVPQKTRHVADSRSDERWARGGELRHNEYLVDSRTRTQYSLYHSCPDTAKAQFAAHSPTIARSLQVLPPGSAPPVP